MRYLLVNPTITVGRTVGGRFDGQEWKMFRAELFNDEDESANPNRLPTYTSMQVHFIKHYEENGAAVLDTTASNANVRVYKVDMTKVDEKWQHIDKVVPYRKMLARIYGRIDRQTGAFQTNKNGGITPVTSITTHMKRRFDEDMVGMQRADGTISNGWDWIEDPEAVVNRLLEQYYKPLDEAQATAAPAATAAPPEILETPEQKMARINAQIAAGATQAQPSVAV